MEYSSEQLASMLESSDIDTAYLALCLIKNNRKLIPEIIKIQNETYKFTGEYFKGNKLYMIRTKYIEPWRKFISSMTDEEIYKDVIQ